MSNAGKCQVQKVSEDYKFIKYVISAKPANLFQQNFSVLIHPKRDYAGNLKLLTLAGI